MRRHLRKHFRLNFVQKHYWQQRTERFSVQVAGHSILVPARLLFASKILRLERHQEAWAFACALQTRSNNGFQRQIAARELMVDLQPWGAPFIVALIGEYFLEIIEDVFDTLTPRQEQALGAFILENKRFWNTTKSRIASYWNVYYRPRRTDEPRSYRGDDYVGFKLAERLEAAASKLT